jgi:Cof subfamily protein (haloacid dehalogenase superfamily)
VAAAFERWLIALDIDGTVLQEDGAISDAVIEQVVRVSALGHEVTLATGRSVATTLPVLELLELSPEFVVCSNGAIILKRDVDAPIGYARTHVETFDPSEVLATIHGRLEGASFAVEDETGFYRYTERFREATLGAHSAQVAFAELFNHRATRLVVISPEHDTEEFLSIVEGMGLHKVSYNVGWTNWLDIAPDGVNKATALERAREWLGIPRSRVMVIGDGRNDIDMFRWAGESGRAVAMAQAPVEVKDVANELTASDLDDGVALVLAGL